MISRDGGGPGEELVLAPEHDLLVRNRTRQAHAVDAHALVGDEAPRLLSVAGRNTSLIETFQRADDVLLQAVRGMRDLLPEQTPLVQTSSVQGLPSAQSAPACAVSVHQCAFATPGPA